MYEKYIYKDAAPQYGGPDFTGRAVAERPFPRWVAAVTMASEQMFGRLACSKG